MLINKKYRIICFFGLLFIVGVYFLLHSYVENTPLIEINTDIESEQANEHEYGYLDDHRVVEVQVNAGTANAKNNEDIDEELQELLLKTKEEIDEGVAELDDYFPIHEDSIKQMISEIDKKDEHLVSEEQLLELQSVLKDNIMAYKHGDANSILASRFGKGASYSIRPEAIQWTLETLTRHYAKEGEIPDDPEKIIRLLVDRRYHGKNGSGYKDLYNELSVKGSHIEFCQTDKMPMSIREDLSLMIKSGFLRNKNGRVYLSPSIEFENSPQKVLKEQEKLTYVDVSIAASDSQSLKYSRLKRYYWSENDATWLPMEVVSLYAKQRKANEFF